LKAIFDKIGIHFEKSKKFFEREEATQKRLKQEKNNVLNTEDKVAQENDKHINLDQIFSKLYHWNEQSEI